MSSPIAARRRPFRVMREQFQRAFSDLTASSELVKQVRKHPDLLDERYDLTDLERRRLIAIVNQQGMECNCILYRANRLGPIVTNLPDSCNALQKDLRSLLSEYWARPFQISDNFWVEAYNFCDFVKGKIKTGIVSTTVLDTLEREQAVVGQLLAQIYPEKYGGEDNKL